MTNIQISRSQAQEILDYVKEDIRTIVRPVRKRHDKVYMIPTHIVSFMPVNSPEQATMYIYEENISDVVDLLVVHQKIGYFAITELGREICRVEKE